MTKKRSVNKKKTMILAVLITVIIVISSFCAIAFFSRQVKETEEKGSIKETDDRISPLTTQGLFFEIHRIRKKGIIGVMDKPGLSWREKPVFNYIINMDGSELNLKGVTDFKTWDTDYVNRECNKHVKEEQEEATVELKIIEKDKKLLRTVTTPAESLSIVYNFKTGRWDGDDHFNDSDGYGHYDGKNYEIWFSVCQTDFDGDDIPYWTEVNILDTDPRIDDSRFDPDEDGIPTSWEWKWGYDPMVWDNHTVLDPDNDGLQNTEEYFMRKWLANPFYPEIYMEAEFMERAPFKPIRIEVKPGRILKSIKRPMLVKTRLDGHEHVFWEESQQMMMERFNQHGITMHIDDGVMGGGGEMLPFMEGGYSQDSGIIGEFYHNNFADERKGIFRYVVIAHGGGWCHPQDDRHYYDCITVPSNREFYVKQTKSMTPRTERIAMAVGVMHELGHSCGFNLTYHQGVDNMTKGSKEVWKNYKSCMNYNYFLDERYFDYSDGSHGENDKDDWGLMDLSYFQRPSVEMEGVGFDVSQPPYNRPRN